ncbi:MAG TPA: hypothetical protein VJO32_17440 [Ktedonobacteraceae bacterium]|nr:hypothetical protein [Ktedonobacteraceae bacterium]
MGQYQQWLHYQEIDRRLRATLDALEQELGQIESHADGSQQPDMLLANPIISALSAHISTYLNGHTSPRNNIDTSNHVSDREIAGQPSNESMETISAALLHWGELPDFGPQGMQTAHQHDIQPFLSLDQAEIELLPEDMFAFFEEHSQTDPQLELPWWLRKITITSGGDESSKPIDQESIRTNRLVQRWVERWGRQSQDIFTTTGESEGIHDDE